MSGRVKSPNELIEIPDFVLEVIQDEIVKHWKNNEAKIVISYLKDLIENTARENGVKYSENWLEFEYIFEANGWNVERDILTDDKFYNHEVYLFSRK